MCRQDAGLAYVPRGKQPRRVHDDRPLRRHRPRVLDQTVPRRSHFGRSPATRRSTMRLYAVGAATRHVFPRTYSARRRSWIVLDTPVKRREYERRDHPHVLFEQRGLKRNARPAFCVVLDARRVSPTSRRPMRSPSKTRRSTSCCCPRSSRRIDKARPGSHRWTSNCSRSTGHGCLLMSGSSRRRMRRQAIHLTSMARVTAATLTRTGH